MYTSPPVLSARGLTTSSASAPGVLRPVLSLGGDGSQVHPLEQVAGRQTVAVDPVQGAGRATVKGSGVPREVDGELVGPSDDDGRGDGLAAGRAVHDELPLRGVLGRIDGVPAGRNVAVEPVAVGSADAAGKVRGGADAGPNVERGLGQVRQSRNISPDQLRDLCSRECRVVHLEVVDVALQQRVGVLRLPDVPGPGSGAREELGSGDVRGAGVDESAVEVEREPVLPGVERDGDGLPVVRRHRAVAGRLGLAARAVRGDGRAEVAVAVARSGEQVARRVLTEVEQALPAAAGPVPAHTRGDGEVGRSVEERLRKLDVGAGRARGPTR